MFFVLSKLLSIFVTPSDLVVAVLIAASMALARGRARLGRNLLLGALVFCLLFGAGPVGLWLARPLEDRFSPPSHLAAPDGIIVLGGGLDPVTSRSRRTFSLGVAGARLTEAAILLRRFPSARLIYSGGSGIVLGDKSDEASVAGRFFVALGIAQSRITIEGRSRDTYENALYAKAFVKPGTHWLLVTSALHMPRAVGVFRRVGIAVIPYPVGYLTRGLRSDIWDVSSVSDGLATTDAAAHEWVGLIAYRLTGKSDGLFPRPAAR